MVKVLIPFTEPDGGERAVRSLLADPAISECEVELLALVAPISAANGRYSVAPALAEEIARETALVWIARLGPLLAAAAVPYHATIVVGDRVKELEHAIHRVDVDRVLVPEAAHRSLERARPVTVVA